jgi:hypothetical protein
MAEPDTRLNDVTCIIFVVIKLISTNKAVLFLVDTTIYVFLLDSKTATC